MNNADKQAVLHCLKSMIDEEVCEECPLYGTTGTDHCEKDCVRLAINALEQEPCDDAVSRQAAIEAIEDDNRNEHYSCFATNNDAECFKQIIRELPSVTAQQKMGHWIEERNDYGEIQGWHCSECYEDTGFTTNCKWDFCPSCGAKMESETKQDLNYADQDTLMSAT